MDYLTNAINMEFSALGSLPRLRMDCTTLPNSCWRGANKDLLPELSEGGLALASRNEENSEERTEITEITKFQKFDELPGLLKQ